MRKSAHPRGQFAQLFFHLGGIKVGVSTFFTLGVDLKMFFTLGCTPPHPHPVPIYVHQYHLELSSLVKITLTEFLRKNGGSKRPMWIGLSLTVDIFLQKSCEIEIFTEQIYSSMISRNIFLWYKNLETSTLWACLYKHNVWKLLKFTLKLL